MLNYYYKRRYNIILYSTKRNLLFTSGNIEYITATPLTSLNLNLNSNLYHTVYTVASM